MDTTNEYDAILNGLKRDTVTHDEALLWLCFYLLLQFPRQSLIELINSAKDQHEEFLADQRYIPPQPRLRTDTTMGITPGYRKSSPVLVAGEE